MDKQLARKIGRNARIARMRARWTQAEVAGRLGMATAVYGRLERGLILPKVVTLRRLASVLSVSADWLLGLPAGRRRSPLRKPGAGSPEVRRLVRQMGGLDRGRLRLLGLLAAELSK